MLNILCDKLSGSILHVGGTYTTSDGVTVYKKRSWSGECVVYTVDHVPDYAVAYVNGSFVLSTPSTVPFKADIESAVSEIKSVCRNEILKIAPSWKQRNMAIKIAELLAIANPSQEELDEILAIRLVWDEIDRLRIVSNNLEKLVSEMSRDELSAFDAEDPIHWAS